MNHRLEVAKQKNICLLLLRNRRKSEYGVLDGNPLSLAHFNKLDPSITQEDLDSLCELGILKLENYRYRILSRLPTNTELTDDEKYILSMEKNGFLVPDALGGDRTLKLKNIRFAPILKALQEKRILRCDEFRYDFRYTKISTGLFGVNRIFLPSSNIFPTLVASDSNDFITPVSIFATNEKDYLRRFLVEVYHANKYRRITRSEACRIQGLPPDFILPESRSRWMKLLGNSVSVPVVETLIRAICKTGVFSVACSGQTIISELEPKERLSYQSETHHSVTHPMGHQLMLFESTSLYLVNRQPKMTLLGTYRRSCREWIMARLMYNYPIKTDVADKFLQLRLAQRLILRNGKNKPLYYAVTGYRIVGREFLAENGYPIRSSRHPRVQKYLLYFLTALDEPLPVIQQSDCLMLLGEGMGTG